MPAHVSGSMWVGNCVLMCWEKCKCGCEKTCVYVRKQRAIITVFRAFLELCVSLHIWPHARFVRLFSYGARSCLLFARFVLTFKIVWCTIIPYECTFISCMYRTLFRIIHYINRTLLPVFVCCPFMS